MDTRALQRALRRKLLADRDEKSDHVYYWVTVAGRDFRAAKFSHSQRGQLDDYILSDTAKRLKLTKAQLDELVDCPFTLAEFLRVWDASAS